MPTRLAAVALDVFASLLAPPRCAACDASVSRVAAFCPPCASTVEVCDDDDAAFVYGGALAQAVLRLKYEGRPDLARPLGDLLWRKLAGNLRARELAGRNLLVVPVPLHPARLAERGYNQSSLLARRVARHLGAPFGPLALARTRDTPKQATLDRTARLDNVAGAFRVRDEAEVCGVAVLLVDDVTTTGATLEACSTALQATGVRSVTRLVLARA